MTMTDEEPITVADLIDPDATYTADRIDVLLMLPSGTTDRAMRRGAFRRIFGSDRDPDYRISGSNVLAWAATLADVPALADQWRLSMARRKREFASAVNDHWAAIVAEAARLGIRVDWQTGCLVKTMDQIPTTIISRATVFDPE